MAAADAAKAAAGAAAEDCDGDAKFPAEVSVTRIMIDSAGKGMGRKGDDIPSSFRSFRKSAVPVDAAAGYDATAPGDGHEDEGDGTVDASVRLQNGGAFAVEPGTGIWIPVFAAPCSCGAPVGPDACLLPLKQLVPAGEDAAADCDGDGSDPCSPPEVKDEIGAEIVMHACQGVDDDWVKWVLTGDSD